MATVGSGLIARRVIEAIEAGMPFEKLTSCIEDLVERSRLLISIPSLYALLRSGRLGKTKGLAARLLKLRPLLAQDSRGRVVKAAMVRVADAGREKLITLLRRELYHTDASPALATHTGVTNAVRVFGWPAGAAVFALVVLVSGIVSAGSLAAALSFLLILILLEQTGLSATSPLLLWVSVPIALLIVFTHRSNIVRLLHGEERRMFGKKR